MSPAALSSRLGRPTGLAALAVVLVGALAAAPAVLPPFVLTIVTLVLVTAILASSVDLLAGEGGLVSIGHAGIAAVAAYGVAWAAVRDLDPIIQLVIALGLTLVASAVYAATTMRTNGIVFLMITLALGIVVYGLALKLSTITGGQNGLTGIRRPAVIAEPGAFYLIVFVSFLAVLGFRRAIRRSPFGLVLRGARESETRMASLGYSVARVKVVAVMLSGLIAGWAGVLFVWQAEFMSPNVASFGRSAMAVVMVILGGVGTALGPLVGAAVVVGTEHWLSSYVARWPTLLGMAFIAVVLFAPGGVVGSLAGRGRSQVAARTGTDRPDERQAVDT